MSYKKGSLPKIGPKGAIPKATKQQPFQRSQKTMRTPPKTNQPADVSIYLCQICSSEDDIEKVRCDRCMLWYHFTCINETSAIAKLDVWICPSCAVKVSKNMFGEVIVEKNPPITTVDLFNINTDNPSDYSKLPPTTDPVFEKLPSGANKSSKSIRSFKSNSVTSNVSRRAALALQRLEEERQLSQQRDKEAIQRQRERDKEYLNQKYSILEDDVMSNLSFDDEELDLQKVESVRQWTENLQTDPEPVKATQDPTETNKENLSDMPQSNSTVVERQSNLMTGFVNNQLGMATESSTQPKNDGMGNENVHGSSYQTISTNYQVDKLPDWLLKPPKPIQSLPDWILNPPKSMSSGNSQLAGEFQSSIQSPLTLGVNSTSSATYTTSGAMISSTAISPSVQERIAMVYNRMNANRLNRNANSNEFRATYNPIISTHESIANSMSNYQAVRTSYQLGSQCADLNDHNLEPTVTSTSSTPVESSISYIPQMESAISRQSTLMSSHTTTTTSYQTSGSNHHTCLPIVVSSYQRTSLLPPQQVSSSYQTMGNVYTFNDQFFGSTSQTVGSSYSTVVTTAMSLPIYQQVRSQPQNQTFQSFGISQAHDTYQSFGSQAQLFGTRQRQVLVTGHGPSLRTSHGHSLSTSQRHSLGTSQSQSHGMNHPNQPIVQPVFQTSVPPISMYGSTFGQQQPPLSNTHGSTFGQQQPPLSNMHGPTFNHQQPPLSNTHGSTFGQQQQPPLSNMHGPTFNHQQPPLSNMHGSTFNHQQPPLSNTHGSIFGHHQQQPVINAYSQPFNYNEGLNQSYDSGIGLVNNSMPPRLTAEQIAARHVMPRELPHFDGDPRNWQAFISAYENSTETCGFTNSENLGRLQKCLQGDAKAAVKSRLVHKDAVPGVIHTLRFMFGRPELIIEKMSEDIQKLPPPRDDDLSALIKFAIAVQNLSSTINHLDAVEHLRNPILINSIIDKLPAQHQLNWAFHRQMLSNPHIGHLGDWLYNIADVASQVVRVTSKSKKPEQKNNNNNKSNNSKPSSYLNAQAENTSIKNKSKAEINKRCFACKSYSCPKLANCKKFKELSRNERWIIVKDNKLCGRCFGNHKFYRCQSNLCCAVEGCKSNHHTLLHNYENSSNVSNSGKKASEVKSSEPEKKSCNSHRSKHQRTDKFRIVPVMLYYKDKSIRDYAYLDEGSNMTTMENSLANELKLSGSPEELCVDWALGQTHSTEDSRIVSVKIAGDFTNAPIFKMNNVRTVKYLNLPTQSVTSSWINKYSHFKNILIATYKSVKPRLLIGLQYSSYIVSLETIEGNENEPIACRTRLGWVVQGPTYEDDDSSAKQKFSLNMCECQSNDNKLHQLVKDYFALESLGVKILEKNLESKEIQRANYILESTTVKKDGRYESGLLWKYDDVELPPSYNMAMKRLVCLESKMKKYPELKTNLFNQINQFVEKGYIRKLSSDEVKNCVYRVWYLPTFPVFNPKKPEKVRLVWDGAAKVKNTSLNSNLLAGPDQLIPLPELLRRFRERAIAITGDIAEMYHQVKVPESDQHVQRFLWREDPSKEPDIYVMQVMTFGSTCSPSVAQYVKNKNASEFKDKFSRAVESIIQNHYVDDMIDCTHTVNEAYALVRDVKQIHQAGGFHIRNFTSNSNELLRKIGENVKPQHKNLTISTGFGTERVLGMFWDTANDIFTYSLKYTMVNENILSGEYCPTKREVLKILMAVFDPLGLLANFLVYGKILLQEIWRSQIDWDEKLTETLHAKWIKWIQVLPSVEKLSIPRLYSPKISPRLPNSIELHTFVDASVEACAATTYLRIKDDEGVDCCLVGAKTKVAPNKPMSVPRLELQAAVLGTRLAENVKKSQTLNFEKHVFWTDSQTVMGWINSEARRYQQFVSFRIGEILEATEPKQWRWVPTKHNVADEATKSKEVAKLESNSRWFKAPRFLYEDEMSWFNEDIDFNTEEELKPCFVMACREIPKVQLVQLERFSQWNRLVRAQAYVFRVIHNWRNKKNRRTGPLTQDELIQGENCLYQRAQRDCFLDEILILKHNEKLPLAEHKEFEKSSELRMFSPYLDERNVLRMRGRVDAATSISQDTKRPIILPRRHRITKLIVDHYHRRYHHINHSTALNEIRQRYVIPALRVVMKGIRASCQKCKIALAKPNIPEMAELPIARLATYTLPFTYVGADYFGPLRVRNGRKTRSRPTIMEKRWVLLFTCLTTRAVHMEISDSLDTNSCIESIENFCMRRGYPREIYSDNGSSFHGADNELKEEFEKMNKSEIEERFTNAEMKWKFNPPGTPHMGGIRERLIQTVKKCLNETIKTRTPNDQMLKNLVIHAENIVNSRPLTYVSLESADEEALTPNHILLGSSNGSKPLGRFTDKDMVRNTYKAVQVLANNFWQRFVLEYMPTLTKRTKWFKQVEPIKVGDVVLVIDENNERNTWPKGIVEELLPGKSGVVRQVMVRTLKGIRRRSVGKLAVLDVKPPTMDEVKQDQLEPVNEGENVEQRNISGNTDLQ